MTISNADQLLLDLLSLSPGHTDRGTVSEFSRTDWRQFIASVRRHGVAGIARHRIKSVGLKVPSETLAALNHAAERQIFCTVRTARAAASAIDTLSAVAHGPIVPIKGVYLLERLYAVPGARSITDVDLLIAEFDRETGHNALVAAGYQYVPKPAGRPASQRAHYERSYLGPDGCLIDVHTALSQRQRANLDYTAMLERAARGAERPVGHAAARALDPEDTLIVLAVHMAQDCFAGPLRQLMDVAYWIQAVEPDLEVALERAEKAGASTVVWAALQQAADRLGAPVDPSLLDIWAPRSPVKRAYLNTLLSGGAMSPYPFRHAKRWAQALTLFPLLDSTSQAVDLTANYAWLRLCDRVETRWGVRANQPRAAVAPASAEYSQRVDLPRALT